MYYKLIIICVLYLEGLSISIMARFLEEKIMYILIIVEEEIL